MNNFWTAYILHDGEPFCQRWRRLCLHCYLLLQLSSHLGEPSRCLVESDSEYGQQLVFYSSKISVGRLNAPLDIWMDTSCLLPSPAVANVLHQFVSSMTLIRFLCFSALIELPPKTVKIGASMIRRTAAPSKYCLNSAFSKILSAAASMTEL